MKHAWGDDKYLHLIGKPEWRPSRRWENNKKMDLKNRVYSCGLAS
jgi:hypothetical protein